MANQPNNTAHELDLGHVSRTIKNTAGKVGDKIFDAIQFIKRNLIIILLLIAAGIALGMYMDRVKVYTHKLYVIPNFGSVEYLYSKIDHINAKLGENDNKFLKEFGLNAKIAKLKIEPVVDIYKFIEGEDNRNYEMFKLMTENNDVSKVMEDEVTARNFKCHLITFVTVGQTSRKDAIDPIMKYLNNSPYYKVVQKEAVSHLERTIAANDTTIKQIDAILNDFSRSKKSNANSNLMYYNDNTQLNEVIKLKNRLTKEQGENKIDLLNSEKIIQDSEAVLNDKDTKGLRGKNKIIMPLIFLFFFVVIYRFRRFYKRQSEKRKLSEI